MRRQNTLVFDDFIYGTTAVTTDMKFNDTLGHFDQTSIFVVADNVTAAATTLTVQVQMSGDGRNWANKNTTAEINGGAVTTGATTTVTGVESGVNPTAAFVRLNITLGGGGGSPVAHLKIYVCNRDAS